MRDPKGHLDFDMDLAKEQSSNNPVYYAQYAHARLCSIIEQGKDIAIDEDAKLLEKPSEMASALLSIDSTRIHESFITAFFSGVAKEIG